MENTPLIKIQPDRFKPKDADLAMREGIHIEKGAVLTADYLEQNENLLCKYIEFFSAYPDLFLDMISPSDSTFKLYFYQRIVLRAIMRYKQVYVTACRAFSKSFIAILAIILQCIFMPGTKRFICAPAKNQSAQIAKEKIIEIYERYPLLKREIMENKSRDMPGNFSKDMVTLTFKNGSQFDVVGARDSQRGGRRNGGLIDEIRDHDETELNEIVIPLMNIGRRLPSGFVNDKEPNFQQICIEKIL